MLDFCCLNPMPVILFVFKLISLTCVQIRLFDLLLLMYISMTSEAYDLLKSKMS